MCIRINIVVFARFNEGAKSNVLVWICFAYENALQFIRSVKFGKAEWNHVENRFNIIAALWSEIEIGWRSVENWTKTKSSKRYHRNNAKQLGESVSIEYNIIILFLPLTHSVTQFKYVAVTAPNTNRQHIHTLEP